MERRFGEIPDWAKQGPIDLKNYNFRVEWHCVQCSTKRAGVHPTITLGSNNFRLWHEYFAVHLGGLPWAMRALIDGQIQVMSVPEDIPQWFDPSFTPSADYRVVLPRDPEVSEEEDARMRQKFADLLRSLGRTKRVEVRKTFRRYTGDELTAMYPPKTTEPADEPVGSP